MKLKTRTKQQIATKKFNVAFKLLNEYELVASSQHETEH